MSDSSLPPSDQNSFVARGGLQRTLKYRNVMRVTYYGLLGAAALSVLAALAYTGQAIARGIPLNPLALVALLLALPLAFFGLARFRFRPYAFTAVHVRPDGFTKVRPWDSVEVSFSKIRAAKVWHVPYFGGRFLLTEENGQTHQFTAALERSEYLLEAFHHARPEFLTERSLLRFRRTAVTSDHSWARLTDRVRLRRLELAALFLLLPVLGLGVSFPFLQGSDGQSAGLPELFSAGVAIFLLNLTLGLVSATAGESYLLVKGRRALARNPNELRRDPELEARVNRAVVWSHLALFCFFLGAAITAFAPQ